jgi:tetratricopeptide (TPR) repeat protein
MLAAYLPGQLYLGYVWDDWQLFVMSSALHDASSAMEAMTRPILAGSTYFRPAVLFSYFIEFQLFGLNAKASHAINLGLHITNALLVLWVARAFSERFAVPVSGLSLLAAGLAYGLHPVLVEPTAWASGRFDLLATTLSLLALRAFASRQLLVRTFGTAAAFLVAALCKEAAVAVPFAMGLVMLYELRGLPTKTQFQSVLEARNILPFVAVIAAGLVYLHLRYAALGDLAQANAQVLKQFNTPLEHASLVGATLLHYFRAALLPFINIGPFHPLESVTMQGAMSVTYVLVLAAAGASLVLWLRNRGLGGLFVLAFVLALLPVMNIAPLQIGGNIAHDRFLTLPLTFLGLALAFARMPTWVPPEKLVRWHRIALTVLGAWLVVSTVAIKSTIPMWSTDLKLWSWAYARHPNFEPARGNAAITLAQAGLLDEAREIMGPTPTEGSPSEFLIRTEIALRSGDVAEAERLLANIGAWIEFIEREGGMTERQTSSVLGLASSQQDVLYSQFTADLALMQSDYAKALAANDNLVRIAPSYPTAWRQRAMVFAGLGEWQTAEESLKRMEMFTPAAARHQALSSYLVFLDVLCNEDKRQDACDASKARLRK